MQLWAPAGGGGGKMGSLLPPPSPNWEFKYMPPPPPYKDNLTRKKIKKVSRGPHMVSEETYLGGGAYISKQGN